MSENLNPNQFGSVHCFDCGEKLEDGSSHIHLSPEDVAGWKSLAASSDRFHKIDHAARYTPFNTNDSEALRAHLISSGHYYHPNSISDLSHSELLEAHETSHEEDAQYPEDEREIHTTIGNRHKHVER
jgi:hypothetical protein